MAITPLHYAWSDRESPDYRSSEETNSDPLKSFMSMSQILDIQSTVTDGQCPGFVSTKQETIPALRI